MKHSNSRLDTENFQGKALLPETTILTFTMIFSTAQTVLLEHLCLMARVNLKRRSGDTCFLLVYLRKKRATCNRKYVIVPSLVVKFHYSLLHHFTHSQPSPCLYPIPVGFPVPSKPMEPWPLGALFTRWLIPNPGRWFVPRCWYEFTSGAHSTHGLAGSNHTDLRNRCFYLEGMRHRTRSFSQPFISLLLPLIIRHNHLCGAAPSPQGSYPEATWT